MDSKPGKKYLFIIIYLLFALIITGYFIGRWNLLYAKQYFEGAMSDSGYIKNLPRFSIFLYIFVNNSINALMSMFLGVFFGIFTIYFIITNGLLIGFALALAPHPFKAGLRDFLASTLPHGIIEITAIVIASSYGLWLGVKLYRQLFYGEKKEFIQAVRVSFKKYLTVIIPLLLIAALIETYITPKVMEYFIKK